MDDASGVLEANESFYAAFRTRDVDAMRAVWSSQNLVACVHPGWPILYGRDEVISSWEAILASPSAPPVECSEARAFVHGSSAFVTCTETLPDGELVATNVFAREESGWKMVHHQAAPFRRRAAPPDPSLN